MAEQTGNAPRAQHSDEWLEQIVAEFSRPLHGYFRRRVNSGADSDDLVQEVFARLSRLENPADVDNRAAYVFSIAANLLRDRARRAGARLADSHEPYEEATHGGGGGGATPEKMAIAAEDLEIVARVIASLVSTVEKHMIAALAALSKNVKGGVQ